MSPLEQPNHETGLEEVVEEVATFKKPSGGGNGKYELKEQYYVEYCPFFYHYSKSDQSKVRQNCELSVLETSVVSS